MKQIALKKELYWKLHNDGITVYSYNADLQKRIYVKDPKAVFLILKHLEKPITVDDLYKSLPNVSRGLIQKVIDFLINKNYLYTNFDISPKYDRLKHFVSTIPNTDLKDYKSKLDGINVLVLGTGTGGSFQLEVLKRLGIKQFTLIDKDKVEAKNLCAQNYQETDIGRYKVDVLKEKLSDSTTQIKVLKKYIHTYSELRQLVDLNAFNYIIDTMDDKAVNLQILHHIFEDYSKTKLILNGYLVQKQMSYIVTQENYKNFLLEVDDLFSTIDPAKEITDNSGSIFNALFMSISVGKMLFDDIFAIRQTNYAYADFFMNDYFIGNNWEYNLYKTFSSTKKSLNCVTSRCSISTDNDWLLPINEHNFLQNKVKNTFNLNIHEKRFLTQSDDFSKFKFAKKVFNSTKLIKDKSEQSIEQSIKPIKSHLSAFIEDVFGDKYKNYVEELLSSQRVCDKSGRFDKKANLTLFNNGYPLIYLTEDLNSSYKLNRFIHELFHTIIYKKTVNSYKHEDLVFNYLTTFLFLNKENKVFKSLLVAHIQSSAVLYMNTFLSTLYEKKVINNDLDSFTSLPILKGVSTKEICQILNIDINYQKPFHCLKYVNAFEKNFNIYRQVASWLLKNNSVEIMVNK
ncbi:ThiF family adenylyltransferase [Lactobacillus gallinarum]|uniref:ThiF family adenylyltransferase n=1 Tax=Lactobacillus gallinarum TaxID=52242 RepID=UPI000B3AFE45|nr:ThiF family adenylyltransferase [Lactobacillus gallinarum]OUP99134.1 hypothetical protein B5E95_08570 [Lactobacillus gallinarum]OUQ46163.1 hypothetical protein B5E63_08610 [Lactobacillus gallinarum]